MNENSPEEAFINHLWYTIIDQRRSVKNVVIPSLFSLLYSGFSQEFALKNPELAKEIITSVLCAYGHELKYRGMDIEKLVDDGFYKNKTPSRTDSILITLNELKKFSNFKNFLLDNRIKLCHNEEKRKELVQNMPFIKEKSISFILRDIEPLISEPEFVPIPIDVNVFNAIQKTGLLFDKWMPEKDEIILRKDITKEFSIIKIRTRIRALAEPYFEICEICGENCTKGSIDYLKCWAERIVLLARDLFLLGVVYCQDNACIKKDQCEFIDECMLSKLNKTDQINFLKKLSK